MATCTGKKKDGSPCGMKAGEDGKCINHRAKTEAPPAAAADERALMPGEKPADQQEKKPARKRAAKKASTSTSADQDSMLGQVLGGVVVGLAILGGVAWALFSPAKSDAAADATKLRAVV